MPSAGSAQHTPYHAPVVAFSLVVIEHLDVEEKAPPVSSRRFALVHEKADRGWWLPGGGVDAGQTLAEAAVREAAEEAGCAIELTGVLRIELECNPHCGRLRVFWHARPVVPEAPLKSVADKESRGAVWATLQHTTNIGYRAAKEVEHCWLRGPEPLEWFSYLCRDEPRDLHAPVAPLDFVHSGRKGGAPEPPLWTGPGDPPRAMYDTSMMVEVIVMCPQETTPLFWGCKSVGSAAIVASAAIEDAVELALPRACVKPSDSLLVQARRLASAAVDRTLPHHVADAALVGLARFQHEIDTEQNLATILLTYVAVVDGTGSTVDDGGWYVATAFPPDLSAVLSSVGSGHIYPLSIVSESEGAGPPAPKALAAEVLQIRRALEIEPS